MFYFDGRDVSQDLSTCGYSCITTIFVIIVGSIVVIAGILSGFRRFTLGMPLTGSCSGAISAACHALPPEGRLDAGKVVSRSKHRCCKFGRFLQLAVWALAAWQDCSAVDNFPLSDGIVHLQRHFSMACTTLAFFSLDSIWWNASRFKIVQGK